MARKDLDNVRKAAAKVARDQHELALAIRRARESGEVLRDIATAADLSHQKISNLLRQTR